MTGRMMSVRKILLFVAAVTAVSCGSSGSTSMTPSPTQPQLAVFMDPASTFSTSDVRDVQDQIVRFDTATRSLVWAADGRSFPGYPVSGLFVRSDRFFLVRFGTKDGQRRAYFTEAAAGTICDVEVVGGQLSITPTTVTVPGS